MSILTILAGFLAFGLLLYLFVSLMKPEWFG